MKKRIRKIALTRETLVDLEGAAVVGGATEQRTECGSCETCYCTRFLCG